MKFFIILLIIIVCVVIWYHRVSKTIEKTARNNKKGKNGKLFKYIESFFLLIAFMIVCLVPLFMFVRSILLHIGLDWSEWIWIALGSLFFSVMIWTELSLLLRKCDITDTGIVVKYFFGSKHITWEHIQQVCICFKQVRKGYMPPQFENHSIICFIKKNAKKSIWGHWDIYSPFSYRKVIYLDYTEELFEKIGNKYPNEIQDFRKSRIYSNVIKSER